MKNNEKILLHFENKIVTLIVSDFDTDIDMDDILKIDYSNIIGEILTFPVIVNRIGILRAESENFLNLAKFDLQIYGAKISESFRKNKSHNETDAGGNKKVKQPTVQEIENFMLLDKGYQLMQKRCFTKNKDYQFVDSLYWASKDKSKKLDYFSNSLKPADFEKEIIEGNINGIMIKINKKLIK